jgi:hypothetical protein
LRDVVILKFQVARTAQVIQTKLHAVNVGESVNLIIVEKYIAERVGARL